MIIPQFHNRYISKARSENAPHVFTIADSAYQNMLHHEEQQNIVFAGESYSGKTTNMRLCFDHLSILGEGNASVFDRVKSAQSVFNALTHAGLFIP
jgi:myosin-3